ncbi:MAG: protein kinase [Planctomycetes bacterium]|nr:protein kinase [Planctomycetota bacterium]
MTPEDDPLTKPQPAPDTERPGQDRSPSTCADTGPTLSYQGEDLAVPPAPDLPTLPGYETLGILGRGGMGVVYRARDVRLGHEVAIKLPLEHCLATPEYRERFLHEARAAAGLRHPNLCTVHRVDEHQGRPFIVMACVKGESLQAWRARKAPTGRDCAEVVSRLARAVQHAHEHGVIHRDIKPANVLVDAETGQPVLMDFGLAKDLARQDVQFTQTGQLLGTPAFMAPEQARGKAARVGPAADVYSLGGVLYHLLCGHPPFAGTLAEVLDKVQGEDPLPPRRLNPNVHRDLEVICLKALAKDPAARYPTALALAEDLERFGAGEPIHARPEGLVARLWRKARHNVGTTVAVTAVVLAAVVVLFVVLAAARRSAARDLGDEVSACLDEDSAWARARVEEVEGQIDTLAREDPDAGNRLRQKLHERLAAWAGRLLSEPVLESHHHDQVKMAVSLLETRDPSRAKALQAAYEERGRRQEVFLDLKAPYDRLADVFAPAEGRVHIEAGHLALREDRGPDRDLPVLTRAPSRAHLRLEATFDASWEKGTRLGLLFSPDTSGTKGYALVLRTVVATPARGAGVLPAEVKAGKMPAPLLSFAEGRTRNAWLSLQIVKNGILVSEQRVRATELPVGPLRVEAKRAGALLSFQAGKLEPLVFQDLFPLTDAGVCGLLWPDGGHLETLRGSRQTLPARPSPLERGDELYMNGQFDEALDYFQRQATASATGPGGQEARLKEGMTQVALRHLDEAAEVFEKLAPEPGDRWPYLAACQLWVVRVRQKRLADAEPILDALLARQPARSFDRLAAVLPREVLQEVLAVYGASPLGIYSSFLDPQRAVRLERSGEVAKLLGIPWSQRGWNDLATERAYRIAGQMQPALRIVRAALEQDDPDALPLVIVFTGECCWLMREEGKAEAGLAELDRRLFEKPGVPRPALLPLLVERSRLLVALNRKKEAEQDLETFLAKYPADGEFRRSGAAWLQLGFLRQDRGDAEGAKAAWHRAYERKGDDPLAGLGGGIGLVNRLVAGALTNELTDEEAQATFDAVLNNFTQSGENSLLKSLPRPSPAVLRECWRSPRGREYARKLAFQSLPFREFTLVPGKLVAAEWIAQGAFAGKLSAEEDALVWKLIEDAVASIPQGTLKQTQLLLLGSTWKGYTNVFGWAGVRRALAPPLRGPIAYVFGQRYLRLGKQAEARDFFQTAHDDAPANSGLRRLAADGLKNLKKN